VGHQGGKAGRAPARGTPGRLALEPCAAPSQGVAFCQHIFQALSGKLSNRATGQGPEQDREVLQADLQKLSREEALLLQLGQQRCAARAWLGAARGEEAKSLGLLKRGLQAGQGPFQLLRTASRPPIIEFLIGLSSGTAFSSGSRSEAEAPAVAGEQSTR